MGFSLVYDFAVGDEARHRLAIEAGRELQVPPVQSRLVPREKGQAAVAAKDETAHPAQLRLDSLRGLSV
jgi:hypothetical protein